MQLVIIFTILIVVTVAGYIFYKASYPSTPYKKIQSSQPLVEPKVIKTQEPQKNIQNQPAIKKQDNSTVSKSAEINTQQAYFLGSLKVAGLQAIDLRASKILVGTEHRQLILFDMKLFQKDNPYKARRGFQNINGNAASAVAIGNKYYFVALDNDKTVAYYDFIGEKGIYFKSVGRFPQNNLHKGPILALHVCGEHDSIVITVGKGLADTFIRVWSVRGEKLQEINTAQVEHYDARFGANYLMLRSWTADVKLFSIKIDQNNSLSAKLTRKADLTHTDGVLYAACDAECRNGISIRKDKSIKLWKIELQNGSSKVRKIVPPDTYGQYDIILCAIHSLNPEFEKSKTLVVLSDGVRLFLCTTPDLKVLRKIDCVSGEGERINQIWIAGNKSVVIFCSLAKSGRILLYNATEQIAKLELE